jgi:hypothetical protein
MTFFYIYFILVMISSLVWFFCCKCVSYEENKFFNNVFSVAIINCLCLPLILFSYFLICGMVYKIKGK